MKKYMIAACIAMTAFASCKKEAPQQNTKLSQHTAIAKDKDDDCANPENPYDYAGYNHNMCLQGTRTVWGVPGVAIQDVHNALATYCQDYFQTSFTQQDMALAEAVNNDNSNDFTNVINGSNLSNHGKVVAAQLVSVMSNIPAATTFTDYKTMIVNFESHVMADNNLTSVDKESLLKSTSVARYSMCYWINEMTDGNPPGTNPVQCRNIFHKIRDWWNAAVDRLDRADALTAIGGGDDGAICDASLHAFFNP